MFIVALNGRADESQTIADGYLETLQAQDPHFITAVTRLTTCTIADEYDPHKMLWLYPEASRKRNEQGKVVMQFVIDTNLCVRKATIVKSSGYFRLDKASLEFAMTLKFRPSMLKQVTQMDDGQPTFAFPMEWKLSRAFVPGDRCSGDAVCADDKPPAPKADVAGPPPEKTDVWMAGYYVYDTKTGYEWNEGHWETPHPGFHWIAPHWDSFRYKWVFVPGVWVQDK